MSQNTFGCVAWSRLARVLEHIQIDACTHAESAASELGLLAHETERRGLHELSRVARDAAAVARRWQAGVEPMAARVQLATLMREMRRELQP